MLLKDVIAKVDALRPNAFSKEQKTEWINECEGIIQTEVFLKGVSEIVQYDYDADKNKALMVRPPHDKLYKSYLYAMIDFANGEGDRYENSMALFNAHLTEFTIWFSTYYAPADNPGAYLNYILPEEEGGGENDG